MNFKLLEKVHNSFGNDVSHTSTPPCNTTQSCCVGRELDLR